MSSLRPTPLIAAASLLIAASGAHAASGPGRVTTDLGGAQPHGSVDPSGFTASAASPDGEVVEAAGRGSNVAHLVAYRRDGSPDPAFGTNGSEDVTVPANSGRDAQVLDLLRRPDGRYVLITAATGQTAQELPYLAATGLTATGAADPAFAASVVPVAQSGFQQAALAPDGGVVLAGSTPGTRSSAAGGLNTADIVMRLRADGSPDSDFGTVNLDPEYGRAGAVGVAPDGSISVVDVHAVPGATPTDPYTTSATLRRLTPAGQPVPGYTAPTLPTGYDTRLLVRDDGSTDVLSTDKAATLTRFRPDGSVDPALPGLSVAKGDLYTDLAAAPDGSDVVLAPNWDGVGTGHGTLRVQRVSAAGQVAQDTTTDAQLAGGSASIFAHLRAPGATSLAQHSGGIGTVAVRPDGSLALGGAVAVEISTGEGAGNEHDQGAVVSLGTDDRLDGSFGGGDTPARLAVRVAAQRFRTVKDKDHVGVKLVTTTSELGLVHLSVYAHGKRIANSTAPAFRSGTQSLTSYLTKDGRKLSSTTRGLKVTVKASFRDILGRDATATARGTLK